MTTPAPQTRAEARAARRTASEKLLRPAFRRWAYGVAVAVVGVAVFAGWLPPTAAPVVLPLIMALFYVNDAGEPRTIGDS